MFHVCRACGTPLDGDSVICSKCRNEFTLTEQKILQSDKCKYISYCDYCGRPFVNAKQVTYKKYNKTVLKRTNRKYCNCNYTVCQNCGSSIQFDPGTGYVPVTCSDSCNRSISLQKARSTCRDRYGVDSPMQLPEFVKKYKENSLKRYGVDNPSKLKEVQEKYRRTCLERYGTTNTFEAESSKLKSKETCLSRYGTTNTSSLDSVRDKYKMTCIERYGVDNASKSKEVKKKIKDTCLTRYGVEHISEVPSVRRNISNSLKQTYENRGDEIIDKRIRTSLDRYGVEWASQLKCTIDKRNKTLISKYGSLKRAYDHQVDTFRRTCTERYGVDNPNKLKSVKTKKCETFVSRYGVDHPMKTAEIKEKVRKSFIRSYASTLEPTFAKNYVDFCEDPVSYIQRNFNHKPSLVEISHTLGGLDCTSVSLRIPKEYHSLLGTYQTSMELEVQDYIYDIDSTLEVRVRDRSVISPYELDFYLPEYRIGIEVNPTYTHNSSVPMYGKTEVLEKEYHKKKSDMCKSNNITLFHIFGYEWHCRQDVVKSMISNLLHKTKHRYYARKLNLTYIDGNVCKSFLDHNHLQGNMYAPVRLALVDNTGDVLCVMTFVRPRITMGKTKNSNKNVWELSRFCNRLNTSVVGGASRLFHEFVKNYNPDCVVSFSDNAHTSGSLYETLGFTSSGTTRPSYVWVNLKDDTYYNRVTCQKRYLSKLFNDDTLDTKSKTEKMIMLEHGYVQVYDSGKTKWIWTRSCCG